MRSSLSPESRSPIRLKPIQFRALSELYPDRAMNASTELNPRGTKLPPLNTCVRSFYRMTDRPGPLFSTYYKKQLIGTRGLKKRLQEISHNRRMSQYNEFSTGNKSDINSFHKRSSANQLDISFNPVSSATSGVLTVIPALSDLPVSSLSNISDSKPNSNLQLSESSDSSIPDKKYLSKTQRGKNQSSVFSGVSGAETSSLKAVAKIHDKSVVISLNAPSVFIKSATRELTHFFQIDEIPKLFYAKSNHNANFLSFLLGRSSISNIETHGRKKTVLKIDIQDLESREDSTYGMSEEQEEQKLDGEVFECNFRMPYAEVYNPSSKENFMRNLSYRQMGDLVTGCYNSWQKIAQECF